jgi:hypothetical protein
VLSHRTEDLDERLRRIEDAVFRNLELGGQAEATLSRHRREASSDDSDNVAEEELWDPRVLPPAANPVTPVTPVTPPANPVTPRPEPVPHQQSPQFEGVLKLPSPGVPVGSCVFIGASSPFSFVSRTGVRWIDAKLGNNSFSTLLQRAEDAYVALDAAGVFGRGLSGDATAEYVETPELRELYINGISTLLLLSLEMLADLCRIFYTHQSPHPAVLVALLPFSFPNRSPQYSPVVRQHFHCPRTRRTAPLTCLTHMFRSSCSSPTLLHAHLAVATQLPLF